MSHFRKYVQLLAVPFTVLAAIGMTVAGSYAAQLGSQSATVRPLTNPPNFQKKILLAPPSLGTQRNLGTANNLLKSRNIAKGISPDG